MPAQAAIAAAATALFLAPWWNRFLGVTLDGYFPLYGRLIADGRVPYRDFFFHLPPLQALVDGGLEALFGPSLLAVRLFGGGMRMLVAALLVVWLSRAFRPAPALLATLATVWLASGDDTDILHFYNHNALFAAVASGYFACRALDRGRRQFLWWVLSGAAAGLAMNLKQTIGLGALVAAPAAVVVLALAERAARPALRALAGFLLGWSVPVLAVVGWLAANDALGPALDQIFIAAAGSKGSPFELLIRVWHHPFVNRWLARAAGFGLAGAVLLAVALRPPGGSGAARETGLPSDGPRAAWRGLLGAALLALAALAAGLALARWGPWSLIQLREAQRCGVFLAQFGISVLAPLVALRTLTAARSGDRPPLAERDVLVLAFVGIAAGTTLGLSYPAGEAMVLPSFAAVVLWALEGRARHRLLKVLRLPVLALIGWATVVVPATKLLGPFDFAQWIEPPVATATKPARHKALRGLRLSPATERAARRITRTIRAHSQPGEPIFVFPTMLLFYWLAERPPATFAALHWFDVTPDSVVDADLQRLLADPPPVVVWQWVDYRMLRTHEAYFRDRRPSALRRMQNRLAGLLTERYVLEASHPSGSRWPDVEVWVRRDRHGARSGGEPSRGSGRPPGEPSGVAEFTAPAGLTVLSSDPAPAPSPAAEAAGTIESNPRGDRP